MTENMAARGEGLAGLREAQIAMRDACFRDMLKLIKDCHADVPHGTTGKLALTVLYDSIERQGVEGFGAALEAAAPAGTAPDVLREIAHIAGAPEGAMPSLWPGARRERLDQKEEGV